MGNASGEAMHSVSGSSGAAPVWADIMAGLHARLPSKAPVPPAGLVRQPVQFVPAQAGASMEPARREWFLAGTEQAHFHVPGTALQKGASTDRPRILAPTDGTVLAVDPDIPPAQQKLLLRATRADVRWLMDGRVLGQGRQLRWQPWPGKHVLQLQDLRGNRLDAVQLEVRGAGVRAP